MKVLVTGGQGFIGRAVAAELHARGHEPVIFDRHQEEKAGKFIFPPEEATRHKVLILPPGKEEPPAEFILGDVTDATSVTDAIAHVDAVIHLAGILGTAETISNPRPAAETNIFGGLNVLEACAQYRTPLVNIAVGNHFEFSTYSITKTTVERFAAMYARYRDLPACSVRAYNVYGPGQSVAQPYGTSRVRKIIPSFISRALHGEPIQVYGDGSQVMDMIYITDAARCLVTALEKVAGDGQAFSGFFGGQVFEAGTGRNTTVREIALAVADEIREQAGAAVVIDYLPMRPGETPGSHVRADPVRVRPLGLEPAEFILLRDGLVQTVSYYRKLFGT